MGIGGFEFVFIAAILMISLGVPIILVVFAVRVMRAGQAAPVYAVVPVHEGMPAVRCAACNSLYDSEYDACPHCARRAAADGSLDVTKWGNGKVWSLLVASVWPLAYILMFLAFAFSQTLLLGLRGSEPPAGIFVFFGVHIFTMLLSLALTGVYLYIAIKSPIVSNAKLLWAAALFFSTMAAFPFAFYFLVWEPRSKAKKLPPLSDAAPAT